MTIKIPPHISWPLAIITLLLMSVGSAFGILVAAQSDGGAQVVDDFYTQAIAWDSTQALSLASKELGWKASLAVTITTDPATPRPVTIMIVDSLGQPVSNLEVSVRALRPQWSKAMEEVSFAPVSGQPGSYQQHLTLAQQGLWDFDILATRDVDRFRTTLRKEILR